MHHVADSPPSPDQAVTSGGAYASPNTVLASRAHRFRLSTRGPALLLTLTLLTLTLYTLHTLATSSIYASADIKHTPTASSTHYSQHPPATMRSKFKDEHPFEKRKAEAERIRQKYADRIPVICEKVEKSDIATIDKKKYLVPADLTVGQFVYVIRKRIKLSPEKAIFIFVDEVLPPTAALMSSIYEEHKDDDGFLYITYSGENTFGTFAELQ
ncbi:uncharacterized protein GIQ15_02880 [Arthroderma uncinatum]|uniref:uncharacterized protein n=1 Tax=Arthroderma uncinatum TaxID=74035 RepID=UPI00144A7F91|nr:uncharacterized protein GIQ15_02880 [Arthroderma uncinatum]KAF3483556.1 hypothetical protein GIQ15_02880 [Arthroderma uncinatum]